MNTRLFFEVLSLPEFWVALCFAIAISAVIGGIAQNVWDTFKELKDEEHFDLKPISRVMEIGEVVWDTSTQQEVIFVGYNSDMVTVLHEQGSKVCVRDVNPKALELL